MPFAPQPFPWWLWLLAALWAGTLLLWQRGILPRDWRWGLGVVVAVYTALLTATVMVEPGSWTLARGLFWVSAACAIGGGLLLARCASIASEPIGLGIVCLGTAGVLASLHAFDLAGLTLLGGALVAGRIVVKVPGPDEPRVNDSTAGVDAPDFSIANRDAWLIGMTAVLVLTAWTGSVRYALDVESQRPGPSRWFTALPSRDRLKTWLVTEPGHGGESPSGRVPAGVPWELIGLSATWVWAVSRARSVESFGDNHRTYENARKWND